MSRGLEEEALTSVRKLRGENYDAVAEIERLRKSQDELEEQGRGMWAALKRPTTIRGLTMCCGLMVFHQMSGINALLYFATTIYKAADSPLPWDIETMITGAVQVVGTIFSLLLVDRAGRRILLLSSAVCSAFTMLIIGVFFELKSEDPESTSDFVWMPLVAMCVFFLVFSIGFGPISWLLIGELFDTDIKGLAASVAVTINYALSFVVTKGALRISTTLGVGGMFWMFSGFSVAGIVFIIIVVPETKKKTFAEIQRMLALYNYG